MATQTDRISEPWRRRLFVPNYQVREAARYANVSSQTVVAWQNIGARQTLSARAKRAALSYMQLIEVAVVAALRKTGVPLKEIKASHSYIANKLASEYPFADYSFKSDGKNLFMDYAQIVGRKGKGTLLRPGRDGQLAWEEIIGRLNEFEYEHKGTVIRWYLEGRNSNIIIDPRIAFGAPAINGTPTWIVKGRWEAGENIDEIAQDFGLKNQEIIQALKFEGVDAIAPRKLAWAH